MKRVFAVVFALLWLGAGTPVLADVPTEMSVQGRLTTAAGAPVPAGFKNFTFKIFDLPAAGIEIWPGGPGETQFLNTDANGLWNAGVGTIIPLTEAVFLAPVRWLEVTVNDGVNPPETLPRIELRTNPYTYRAATSQQADSLAGNSFGDIADMFVDEAADTMSGQLRIDWDHTGGKSTLEIENINNGYLSTWSDFTGTWGLSADANSDNGPFNLGVGGECLGDNTANYGVYGVARGFGSANFAVFGNAGDGINNFAGYFQGDLEVQNFNGDAGVNLPDDAISASEILDEPGIAQGRLAGSIILGGGAALTTITSVTLTTPVDGYIHLHGRCYVGFVGGTSGQAFLQVSDVANATLDVGIYSLVTSTVSAVNWDELCNHRTYFKAAGTHTFYLEGMENYAGTVEAGYATLTAMFFPKSYGTVSTVVAQGERGDFATASSIRAEGPGAGLPDQGGSAAPVYEVDLRELELKVARAEAEAERARRELVEAKLRSSSGPVGAVRNPGEEPKQ